MKHWAAYLLVCILGLPGCSEQPPPAGPLGALPADPQAAREFRAQASLRVLREIDAEQAALRERAVRLKSEIRARELHVSYSWQQPAEPGDERPILRLDVRGDLTFPTEYGPIGSTCACVVQLRKLEPGKPPRQKAGDSVLARYVGGGRGVVQAVIETTRWEAGPYDVALLISGREVEAKAFDVTPPGESAVNQ